MSSSSTTVEAPSTSVTWWSRSRCQTFAGKLKAINYGCGAVGRAVASDTRGSGYESSHQQLLLNIYLLLTVCRKDENKEKEAGNGPFKKITLTERNKL